MLNSSPTVTQAPMLPIPAAGAGAPPHPAGAPPFAQALGKAAAEQRSAAGEAGNSGNDTDAAKHSAAAPASDAARSDAAAPAGAARRLAALKAAGRHAAVDPSTLAKDSPAAAESAAPADADRDQRSPAMRESGDAAAWMPGLAWPRAEGGGDTPDAAGADDRTPRIAPDTGLRSHAHAARGAPAWDTAIDAAQGRAGAAALAQARHADAGLDGRAAAEAGRHAAGLTRQTMAAQVSQDSGSTVLASPAALGAGWASGMAAGMAAMAPASAPGATPSAFQAELHAELGSSAFAPALGTMLSVLLRDGVEQAQLKLNPAEMGPIEVRIRLDGSQAQVDFSAAQADTRQALQDAVPALAGALRESGLTLTGGGVFEQPREPRGQAQPRGERNGPATAEAQRDSDNSPAAVPGMPRERGVVDLYA